MCVCVRLKLLLLYWSFHSCLLISYATKPHLEKKMFDLTLREEGVCYDIICAYMVTYTYVALIGYAT